MNSDPVTLTFEKEPYTKLLPSRKYASQLRNLYKLCMADPCFSVDVLQYSSSILATSEEVGSELASCGICGRESPSSTQQLVGLRVKQALLLEPLLIRSPSLMVPLISDITQPRTMLQPTSPVVMTHRSRIPKGTEPN